MPKIKKRTFILGLGGTGTKTLEFLAERLQKIRVLDEKGNIKPEEPIRLAGIYSHTSDRRADKLGINPLYLRSLNINAVGHKLKKLDITGNEHYKKWYPDPEEKYIKAKNVKNGAGQWRSLGRLAMLENEDQIKEVIGAKSFIQELEEWNSTTLADSDALDVFVISSMAGGTGSGLLMDVLNRLRRHVGKDDGSTKTQISITAYLLMPGVFRAKGDMERLEGNSYAAIKELSAFAQGLENFVIDYPTKKDEENKGVWLTEHVESKSIPVDDIFLFDIQQISGFSFGSDKECYEYMASMLYLNIASTIGVAVKGSSANKDSLEKQGYIYSTCTGLIIELPEWTDITAYVKSHLKTEILVPIENTSVGEIEKMVEESIGQSLNHPSATLAITEVFKDFKLEFLDEIVKLVELAGKSTNSVYVQKMNIASEKIEGLKKDEWQNFFDELNQLLNNKGLALIKNQSTNEYLKDVAQKRFADISQKVEEIIINGHPRQVIDACIEIEKLITEYCREHQSKTIQTNGNSVLVNFDTTLKDFFELSQKYREVISDYNKSAPKFSLFNPIKAEIAQRFKELNIIRLVQLYKKVKNISLEHRLEENLTQEENRLLIESHLQPFIDQIAEYRKRLEKECENLRPIEEAFAKSKEDVQSNEEHEGKAASNFEHRIKLNNLLENVAEWTKPTASLFWKERNQTAYNLESFSDLLNIESEIDTFIEKTVSSQTKQWSKHPKSFDFKSHILNSINVATPTIFNNTITHSATKRLYWSVPKWTEESYFFSNEEEQDNFFDEIKARLSHAFPGAYVNKPELSADNNITIYYEHKDEPAINIKSIEEMRRKYLRQNGGSHLLHIHKDYHKLPEPIPVEELSGVVLCGNPNCTYDISQVPRDVNICPKCHNAILNRCGNPKCKTDSLLSQIGGLKNLESAHHCPTCRERITSFKWMCTNGHGLQLRKRDPYCPICYNELKEGLIPFDRVSKKTDDRFYPVFCIGCEEKKKSNPLQVPSPEYVTSVPLSMESYVKERMKAFDIKRNECYECGAKIYPECPHSDGEPHFLEVDASGLLTCRQSDFLHVEKVDFYECRNCHYPVKWDDEMSQIDCPRCHRELVKCGHCSDIDRLLIDKKTLKQMISQCPVCNNKITT